MSVLAAVGALTSVAGMIGSNSASNAAADAQAQANADAHSINQQNMDFQLQQYENNMADVSALEDVFGPVRDNISNYYNNMSPEMYQMQGAEAIQNQFTQANDNINAMFSNNGMYGSGQQVSANVALEAMRADSLANNKQTAQQEYNAQQQNWLEFGVNEINANKGFQANSQAGVSNSMSNAANSMMQGGNAMANIGMQQAAGWGGFATGGMQMAGYAMGGGFDGKTTLDANGGGVWGAQNGGINSPSSVNHQVNLANAGL